MIAAQDRSDQTALEKLRAGCTPAELDGIADLAMAELGRGLSTEVESYLRD